MEEGWIIVDDIDPVGLIREAGGPSHYHVHHRVEPEHLTAGGHGAVLLAVFAMHQLAASDGYGIHCRRHMEQAGAC
jgi:hypothetical protein